MKSKKYFKFSKKELKNLPINYHYFESVNIKDNGIVLLKAVPPQNIFMTSKKYVLSFYKPISKII